MTLKELLAVDEGGDCTGCPVCEPRRGRRHGRGEAAERRSVSVLIESNPAVFSVRYTDARTDRTEEGVMPAPGRSGA